MSSGTDTASTSSERSLFTATGGSLSHGPSFIIENAHSAVDLLALRFSKGLIQWECREVYEYATSRALRAVQKMEGLTDEGAHDFYYKYGQSRELYAVWIRATATLTCVLCGYRYDDIARVTGYDRTNVYYYAKRYTPPQDYPFVGFIKDTALAILLEQE